MANKIFCVFVLMCCFCYMHCWTNYRVNLQSLQVDYYNSKYANISKCEIKKINRTYSYLSINGTILQTIQDVTVSGQLYKNVGNRYRESFLPISVQYCSVISAQNTNSASGFSDMLVSKFKAPLFEIIYAPGQKMPKSCPIQPDNYYGDFHIDESKIPAALVPEGKWKIAGEVHDNNKVLLGKGSAHFEIVFYSSEKQRKRV